MSNFMKPLIHFTQELILYLYTRHFPDVKLNWTCYCTLTTWQTLRSFKIPFPLLPSRFHPSLLKTVMHILQLRSVIYWWPSSDLNWPTCWLWKGRPRTETQKMRAKLEDKTPSAGPDPISAAAQDSAGQSLPLSPSTAPLVNHFRLKKR